MLLFGTVAGIIFSSLVNDSDGAPSRPSHGGSNRVRRPFRSTSAFTPSHICDDPTKRVSASMLICVPGLPNPKSSSSAPSTFIPAAGWSNSPSTSVGGSSSPAGVLARFTLRKF